MDCFQAATDMWVLVLKLPWEGSVQARSGQAVCSYFCSRAELQPLHDTGQAFSSFLSMRSMEEGLPL